MFYDGYENDLEERDPLKGRSIWLPKQRRSINMVGMCWNMFLPWFLFVFIFWVQSFDVHYMAPCVAWFCAACGYCISICTALYGCMIYRRDRPPSWYFFLAATFFVATMGATVCGDLNFRFYYQTVAELNHINFYSGIDPATETGDQVMDAGRVYFTDGTKLKLEWSQGFKHETMYCVAPIVNTRENKAGTIDFWAVGKDCCNGESMEFRCGEYKNSMARSGLRLLDPDDRFFYRLAVQQAEAAYGIRAKHPVFFKWQQDPVHSVLKFQAQAVTNFMIGCGTHFIFNFFVVLWATFLFAKIGPETRHGDL